MIENASLNGDVDLSDYYTKSEVDSKYQIKGDYVTHDQNKESMHSLSQSIFDTIKSENYLTEIPSEYITEQELQEIIIQASFDGGETNFKD
jgi:hypothetical protein